MLFIIVSYLFARKAKNLLRCGWCLMAVYVGLSTLSGASHGPANAGAAFALSAILSLLTVWLPVGIIAARRP